MLQFQDKTSNPSFRILQQRRSRSVNTPTPIRRPQSTLRRTHALLTRSRLLQPIRVLRLSVLALALVVVAVAQTKRVVVLRLGIGRDRGQGLPLLAARLLRVVVGRGVAVEGVDFVYGAGLGRRDGGGLEEVGVGAGAG